jgi:hypothetical protein
MSPGVFVVVELNGRFVDAFSSRKKAEDCIWQQQELVHPMQRKRYKIIYILVH